MAEVRQTIDHFVTLGRYADIRVYGEADGDGVRLRYGLVPIDADRPRALRRRRSALDEAMLRTTLTDQFGASAASPAAATRWRRCSRRATGRTATRRRGSTSRLDARRPGPARWWPSSASRPEPRTVVGRATVEGDGPADLLTRLGLTPGRPLDRETLEERVTAPPRTLRGERLLRSRHLDRAARGRHQRWPTSPCGCRWAIGCTSTFTGDPLPASRRRSLVPIEQRALGGRGSDRGRQPQHRALPATRGLSARPRRRRRAGAPTASCRSRFAVRSGPLHVLESLAVDGVQRGCPPPRSRRCSSCEPGEPFVDARVATVAAALAELYRVRGFAAVAGHAAACRRCRWPTARAGGRALRDRRGTAHGRQRACGSTASTPSRRPSSARRWPSPPASRTTGPSRPSIATSLERRYRNLGYQRAVVDARARRPSEDATAVAITYVVREGPQTRVDHVLVTGTDRARRPTSCGAR